MSVINVQNRLYTGALSLACFVAAGCGYELYEQRVAATQAWWGYLDRLDQNLAGPWRSPPVDEFRTPKAFKEIPAPQPTQNPDGSLSFPDVDPRQPDYANFALDGLIGAWRADVAVGGGGEERQTLPAYLYVASNGPLFLAERVEEAIHFTGNTTAYLETALGATGRKEPAAVFPKGHQFVKQRTFEVTLFNSELPIHGTRYSFEMYATQQGDNQVIVLLAVPEGMDPSARISERLQLTLESMKVSDQRPQAQQAGAAPGQPAPAGGSF
jgi:hypothetical protein